MHFKVLTFPWKNVIKFNQSVRICSTQNTYTKNEQHYIKDVLYRKLQNINTWYTKIIGLDEVRQYQDRVVQLQEKLLNAQDKRREISQNLVEIRRKSIELQDKVHKVKRQDDLQGFLELMKEETEILKKERDVSAMFQETDRTERELFSAFTNAVRDSHEKQRSQLEYTKYFGLILSILGSFLTFCYSTLKKHELKKFIEQKVVAPPLTIEPIINDLNNSQQYLNSLLGSVKTVIDDNKNLANLLNNFSRDANTLLQNDDNFLSLVIKNHEETKDMLQKINYNLGSIHFSVDKDKKGTPSKYIPKFEKFKEEANSVVNNKFMFYGIIAICSFLLLRIIGD